MNSATHYIIDLETMSAHPNAAIVAIGAACVEQAKIVGQFYVRVDLESSARDGGDISASTVQWWLKQSPAARAEIDGSKEAESIFNALGFLRAFMANHNAKPGDCLVWGNGSSFDNVILRSAYAAAGLDAPWQFWNDRDLRTLLALYPQAKQAIQFEGIKHHALDDALHEARLLCAALTLHAPAYPEEAAA